MQPQRNSQPLSKQQQSNASEKNLDEKKKSIMNSGVSTNNSTPCTAKDAMNKDIPVVDISDDEQAVAVNSMNKNIEIIHISDSEECKQVTRKRRRLIKKGNFVNKKVIEILSSDDEKTNTTSVNHHQPSQIQNNETTISDDEAPVQFKRTKTTHNSTNTKNNKYMLCYEDTDDEYDNYKITSEDDEDGVWTNINDLPEPFYPLKEYKPKYVIPDEDITEDSPTGDYKYTVVDEEYDTELLEKHNMNDYDMWDDMVDIDGKLHGKDVHSNYIDEEAWEVDSDAYSKRSVSDSDDLDSFINDNTTDYESTDNSNSEDDF